MATNLRIDCTYYSDNPGELETAQLIRSAAAAAGMGPSLFCKKMLTRYIRAEIALGTLNETREQERVTQALLRGLASSPDQPPPAPISASKSDSSLPPIGGF